MADEGKFGPNAKKSEENDLEKGKKHRTKTKGTCDAC